MGKQTGKKTVKRSELLLNEESPFIVTEAYKALRTNIMFSLPGTECKCVGITSSSQAEGKSTNTINFAIAMAQIGKNVLLIDADMRLPTVASSLGITGQPGLSNLLIGESDFGMCRYHVDTYGFDVIPSGTIPPDPTRLLGSKQMEVLLSVLRKHYHYIIMDLPPVCTVTDAALLAKVVDGYLLLVRHNAADHRAVTDMIGRMKKADAKILGFLYVGAEVSSKGYYKNYGYGYGK